MYRYREVIARLRLGDTDRQIAKANLLGRPKTALLRRVAKAQGWLVSSQTQLQVALVRPNPRYW